MVNIVVYQQTGWFTARCLCWQRQKRHVYKFLPPVLTLCRTTIFIWHVLATENPSTFSVASPSASRGRTC